MFGIEALKTQSKRPREGLSPDQVKFDGAASKRLRVEASIAATAGLPADAGTLSSAEHLGTQSSAARRPESAGQAAQANGASTPASQTFSFSTPKGTQSSSPKVKPPLPLPRPNSSRCLPSPCRKAFSSVDPSSCHLGRGAEQGSTPVHCLSTDFGGL